MQSATPSHWQQTFEDRSQDSSSVCSEENDLPVEVHHYDNDRGLKLRSLNVQANSSPGVTTEEAVAVDLVNRLPVEMLSEIFLACAHIFDRSELIQMDRHNIPPRHHRLMFARNAVPYTVSSVCKRWRSIGLSTPKLWSKFTILAEPYYLKCGLENFMVALRTWLKRSKNHSLQFTCLSGPKREEEIITELSKHKYRWHIACFGRPCVSSPDRQGEWFRNNGLKAENCDTLEFHRPDDSPNIAFEQFPNLRRLRIHPDCLAVEEARGLSLTHLALTNLEGTAATFLSYLQQFPSLISFEVSVYELEYRLNHPPLTTFTHTTLTELSITECFGVDSFRDILANIHLPSIRRLHLNFAGYPNGDMSDIVNDFIRRHESRFTDLELSGLEFSSWEVIGLLHIFSKHLTSYHSEIGGMTDDDVKRLTLNPLYPYRDLAPNLSSISLDSDCNIYGTEPSGDLLAEMILSRWARNPHVTFKLRTRYSGLNPLSNPRIARRIQYNPGLLNFIGRPFRRYPSTLSK